MAKVLFSPSYFYRFDAKQWKNQRPYPPYGTIYAAALLRENGFHVDLFDTHLRESTKEILPILEDQQADYFVIYDDGFNYLTKMCLTAMREAAFELTAFAKKVGCKVIVCSSDSSDHYDKYMEAGADYVVLGEGEITLLELLQGLSEDDFDPGKTLGIVYEKDGNIVANPRRPVLRDLDSLPDPAWDLVDVAAYRNIWMKSMGYFSLNIATTRGCPYKCNWCAKPIYGNRYNSRSPQRVAAELQMLQEQYGAQHFWFCDDIFGLKPGWVQTFRDEVQSRQLNLKYLIQSRVDLLLQADNIEALAQSGLDTVWVGTESGSQKILDAMDKGTTVEQVYESTKLLREKGVKVGFFLQFGYLGETMEDIHATHQMLLDLMPDDIGISVSYPLPGTSFYDKVIGLMEEKQNWTDSDDLAMMYPATFPPQFYKRLHRFTHKIFRRKQGWQRLRLMLKNPFSAKLSHLRSVAALAYYVPAAALDKIRLQQLAVPNQNAN